MTPEELKEKLAVHLAASILDAGLSSRDNIFRTVSALATVAIPSYIAALAYLGALGVSTPLMLRLAPIALWLGSLFVCVLLLFPRQEFYDLKNLESILDVHTRSLGRARLWSLLSLALLIGGIVVATLVLLGLI